MSWAPVYRAYGHNNRTLMCLLMNRHCLELRMADAGCNFYLGAAIAIAAGLDGVRRKLDRDDLAKETLGEAFHATLTDYKRSEWNDYSLTLTDWERRRYLHQW